ncbi:MAG: phosphatase PAP2 family protein, partial [Fidelibacterota bacterium]
FHLPRPEGVALVEATGFDFPSGHAQNAMVLWGYLAWTAGAGTAPAGGEGYRQIGRQQIYWSSGIVIFLIGLSRVYLGVHYPASVIGGWSIGFAMLLICIYAVQQLMERGFSVPTVPAVGLVFLVSLWLANFYVNDLSVRVSGAMFGVIGGAIIERRSVRFACQTTLWKQGMKLLVGLLGVLLVKEGTAAVLPETSPFVYTRYALTGAWIGLGAPWAFVRLRLAPSSPARGTRSETE